MLKDQRQRLKYTYTLCFILITDLLHHILVPSKMVQNISFHPLQSLDIKYGNLNEIQHIYKRLVSLKYSVYANENSFPY